MSSFFQSMIDSLLMGSHSAERTSAAGISFGASTAADGRRPNPSRSITSSHDLRAERRAGRTASSRVRLVTVKKEEEPRNKPACACLPRRDAQIGHSSPGTRRDECRPRSSSDLGPVERRGSGERLLRRGVGRGLLAAGYDLEPIGDPRQASESPRGAVPPRWNETSWMR